MANRTTGTVRQFKRQLVDVGGLLIQGTNIESEVETVAGTSYTLEQTDHNKIIDFTSGSAVTVTVPAGLTLPYVVGISQGGAGQVTVSPDVGVTVNEPDAQFKTEKRYCQLTLAAFSADTYRLSGPTAA
jgi:hypothetical protein